MSDVDLITAAMRRVTADGFDPHAAPWDHKVCVLLHAAQGIIDNVGFEYFFESPFDGDPDMEDFPRVFEAVGATSTAKVVREALAQSKFPSPNYGELNEFMWKSSEENYVLLGKYIESHRDSYA